jgi:glutaredoxin
MIYTIYGRPGCQPCQNAKELLKSKGKEFQYIDITNMIPVELEDFKDRHRSVPQIYLEDKHLGGLQDLTNHLTK